MDVKTLFDAVVLGVVEGLTEFIPVSSTGHLLLLGHFLGFKSTGRAFEVLIQFGSILAIVGVYATRLWSVALALPTSARARRFVASVAIAFLPAAIVGVLAHDFIKRVLFETPLVVCVTLLLGGIVLLVVDRLPLKPRYGSAYDYPLWLALVVGCFQTLALIPGMSRSGSTIVGALLFRADKRSAAEFSFFLAMPTMAGAFAYDLYKNRDALSSSDILIVAIGFVAAFLSALLVVRRLLDFVSHHGYSIFAWWRIAVGIVGIAALWFTGGLGFGGGSPVATPAVEQQPAGDSDAPRVVTTTSIRVTPPPSDFPIRDTGSAPLPPVTPVQTRPVESAPTPAPAPAPQAGNAPAQTPPASGQMGGSSSVFDQTFSIFDNKQQQQQQPQGAQ